MQKIIIYTFFLFLTITSYSQNRTKLGDNVNTNCIEVNPIISSDGKILYFCRAECEGNYGGDDIWYSIIDSKGNWQKAVNIGEPLNDKNNNFASSISADGNELILGNVYRSRYTIRQGISKSRKTADGWTYPENLEIEDFYNLDESNSFWLSYNGLHMLMTVNRYDGHGMKDIYVSHKIEKDRWSAPLNLGNVINSPGEEITPYLAADGKTLYFSSNGHKGLGDMDIFISRRLDDTWTNWTEPVNLGPNINTPNWDAYYKLSAKADYAYYVIANNLEDTDIYRVDLDKDYTPYPVMLVIGNVNCAKQYIPLASKITYRDLETKELLGEVSSDETEGKFTLVLPYGEDYEIEVTTDNYFNLIDTIRVKDLKSYKETFKKYELRPFVDSLMLLKNLLLPTGQTLYTKTGQTEPENIDVENMRVLVSFLKEHSEYFIEIVGHTDDIGSEENNYNLSVKRAQSTADYLVKKGVSRETISLIGRGELYPIAPNETAEGRALNRRIEMFLRKK